MIICNNNNNNNNCGDRGGEGGHQSDRGGGTEGGERGISMIFANITMLRPEITPMPLFSHLGI